MANSHTYSGPSTRWSVGEATTIGRLNIARINADHLHEALNTLIDTDNPGAITISSGVEVTMTSSVEAAQSARRILFLDLDNPDQTWDYREFMLQARASSWWASLGAPPVHGALWINEAQTAVVWWDLEADAAYVTITAAASGIIDDATPVLTDIKWLDGKIYLSGTGGADVTIIDLLRDGAEKFDATNHSTYLGTLGDFTGTAGWRDVDTAPIIVSATVNAIAVVRDPALQDEFSKPRHWWAAGTDGGLSVYSAADEAIYDSSSVWDCDALFIDPDGYMWHVQDEGATSAGVLCLSQRSIFAITADAFTSDATWVNTGADALDLAWSDTADLSAVASLPGRSAVGNGGPVVFLGSGEGLYIVHTKPGDEANGALIRIDADYFSPYMKGDTVAAYPLHDVNDVSANAKTLTNNNTVTFTAGVFGNAATFDGVNQYLSLTPDADFNLGVADWAVSCWFASTSASNPGANECFFQLKDSAATLMLVDLRLNTSGFLWARLSDDGFASADSIVSIVDYYDAAWHHVVYQRAGAVLYLYVDGVLCGSVAVSNAAGAIDPNSIGIGANAGGGEPYTGQVDHFTIAKGAAYSEREIKFIYQRGVRAQQSTITGDDALPAVGVVGIQADPGSGNVIVCTDDGNATILDSMGIPIATDAVPSGTLRSAAIRHKIGQDTPSILIGGSTDVEVVQPNIRILDGDR